MAYKSNFRPCEILQPDGVWRENVAGGTPQNSPQISSPADVENVP
jgi:hypothetical protein